MTKEITKAFVLQQIEDKFKLRELIPERFAFSELVIPTYDIEPHLEEFVNTFMERSVTATGGVYFLSVPPDERWTLYRYDVIFMGAGAYTVSGVYTIRDPAVATDFCYLDLGAAKSVSYHIHLPHPVVLQARTQLLINIDGYTSTQDLRLYIDYSRETIR